MRVLFCGSREWGIITADEAQRRLAWRQIHAIEGYLLKFRQHKDVIIHGGARGADQIAGELATKMGFTVKVYEADWDKHGKAAGPIRNGRMLKEGKPDLVVAFHVDLRQSKGTLDMVRRARKAGVRIIWVKGYENRLPILGK